ncbi:MAG: Eco57I restriction-modification methylase domain-containing protein [Methanoregulaceae archaeon]|nr:Eco57I restriction-modification methylase domain-containing protein [Methanoregulaceae archaeon]
MPAPPSITGLIERYRAILPHAAERDTVSRDSCREFIDLFLENIGWGPEQPGECRKQRTGVSRDIPFRSNGRIKSVDYVLCTQSGGVIAIMIGNPSAADPGTAGGLLDLRRYAWNAGLKLAILTNFGESAIYDATIPVQCGDDAAIARIARVAVDQYAEKWDRIAAVISRECVLGGSPGLFLKERGVEKGAAGIRQLLLGDIEEWRLLLAKRIALRNHGLSAGAINEAVQQLLSRILFLRIAEDRGIGQYGILRRVIEGGSAYGRLCGLFRYAEDEYGGGLFRFSEGTGTDEPSDDLTLTLSVDDESIKKIITRISPPESPYEFSVIPAQILAEVFSPFLGKVIRLTTGHQAFVEERPEIRAAGGPSGTPREIAAYIVRETLFELVKGKTPRDIAGLRVLDPACGSGLFLVMAYEFLLDWHLRWYTENLVPVIGRANFTLDNTLGFLPGPGKEGDTAPPLPIIRCTERGGNSSREEITWRLTAGERKRILLATIFGVDIDRRAVGTTRFLLLVKLMEDMDHGGLPLPDLSGNIRCGNSLVGPDIFNDPDASLIDPRSWERLHVFDWEAAFPGIMKSGGFDMVTGHPPHFRRESLKGEKEYLEKRYRIFPGTADLYHCFVEKGIMLLRPGGQFSAILPDAWLRADNGTKLRSFLRGFGIREIIDTGNRGGGWDGLLQSCSIRAVKEAPGPSLSVVQGEIPEPGTAEGYLETHRYTLPMSRLGEGRWILSDTRVQDLVSKVQKAGTPLGEYVMGALCPGIRIGNCSALIIDEETKKRLIEEDPESAAIIRPFLSCKGLQRYLPPDTGGSHLIMVPLGTDMKKYPAVFRYLMRHKKEPVQGKRDVKGEEGIQKKSDASHWYEHPNTYNSADLFEKPKILFPGIARERRFTLDVSGHYCPDTCRIIGSSSPYLLSILNSRLIWFVIRNTVPPFRGDYRRLYGPLFEHIPVFVPDFDDRAESARHDSLEALVGRVLLIRKRSAETNDIRKKTLYRQQIMELDRRIDGIVYELYRLSPEEIMIVEKDTPGEEPSC